MWSIAGYIIIGIIVALSVAAWDNGKRWDTNRYLFLGLVWPVALLFMGGIVSVRWIKSKI